MVDRGPIGVRVAAVAGPVAVAAVASALRDVVANTSAALLLVVVIVAIGVAGDRVAGVLAALSAAAAFNFFLTVPYFSFVIADRDDIETAVLLLVIGIAVTEIALWGRRQRSRSQRREGYLSGVAHAARLASHGSSRTELIGTVERMITELLDLDDCRFEPAPAPPRPDQDAIGSPVLRPDASLVWGDHIVDVAREGLPTMDLIEVPAGPAGSAGRFLLTASTQVRRPDREQLLVVVTLAEQIPAATGAAVRE